ncbi:MAG: TIGR03013 family PEP-CTERM/XrtA system glycosyltransferase [Rhodocyclaceae bacterium]|nr:TIGR03013 family PEP-CTERM/XrtA system glycosyltransferase [Rhodocyclaceae bacterium]
MLKIFSHHVPSQALAQFFIDACMLALAVVLSVMLQSGSASFEWRLVVPSAVVFALVMMVLNSAFGLYRPFAGGSLRSVIERLALPVVVSVPVAYVIFQMLPWGHFMPEAAELTVLAALGGVMVLRGLSNRGHQGALMARRVLVLGAGADAAHIERVLSGVESRGLEVVGFVSMDPDEVPQVRGRVLGAPSRLLQLVREERADEVIVAVRERRGGVLPLRDLLDCKMLGVKVLDLSSFFERVQGQVRIDSLRASWLIYGDGFRQGLARSAVKRTFDILAALVLLTLALPVMLISALIIMLQDGAPVFYRQERVGQHGRTFKVIKFRSMRNDAEKDGKPRWAAANDDRVTRYGKLMRLTRIDELPQLFNVLKGEMSLVGPRPERPYFVDQLTAEVPFYAVRHCVKPGLTGWAQVRYQYGASVDDAVQKLQYDLYYVKNHTLFLDSLILCETVRVVLTGQGAH